MSLSAVDKIFLLRGGLFVLWVDSLCFGVMSLMLWGEYMKEDGSMCCGASIWVVGSVCKLQVL